MTTKRAITKHDQQRWEVDFGLDTHGTRVRQLFRTEKLADDAIDQYQKDVQRRGRWWALLPELERQIIEVTCKQIKAAGLSIGQVWADYQRWKADNTQTAVEPMPYEDVVKEWARRKLAAGQSERYVDEVADLLLKFGEGRLRQPIHEIPPKDLEAWITTKTAWGLSTKKTNQSRFASLWTVAKAKGWVSYNIVDRLEPITRPGAVIEIYPNDTVLHLLGACLEHEQTQKVLAPLVLGLFGCMRPEEVEKPDFGWHLIKLDTARITVPPNVAKTGDQRVIRLQPVAVEWLRLAQTLENPLPAINERRLVDACCETIGLTHWLRDGLRKCCATHLRAIYKNDYDVIRDCGNSIRILLKHYADLETPESVSLDYWKITPKRVRKFLKSEAWPKFVREATEARPKKKEEVKKTSVGQPTPTANENANTAS